MIEMNFFGLMDNDSSFEEFVQFGYQTVQTLENFKSFGQIGVGLPIHISLHLF